MMEALRSVGARVMIDREARILRPDLLSIGNDVRIDAGVILSGSHPITIGDHVHIAAGAKVFAAGGLVLLEDFSALSADVKVYTATDDYTGGSLTNPTVPDEFKDVRVGDVRLMAHALVGAGSVILPGVSLGFGSAVGALSLISTDVDEGAVMGGVPARVLGSRNTDRLRDLESRLRERESTASRETDS